MTTVVLNLGPQLARVLIQYPAEVSNTTPGHAGLFNRPVLFGAPRQI